MLRENLDATTSVVGLETKVLAGQVYATVVGDDALAADVRALARHVGVADAALDEMTAFARGERAEPASAALLLARAASTSPAGVDDATVDACRDGLTPEAIVEVVAWLAVLQLLHRLHGWVAPTA